MFGFPSFAIFASRLSSSLFTRSLHVSSSPDSGIHLMTSRMSRMLRMSLSRILSRGVLSVVHLKSSIFTRVSPFFLKKHVLYFIQCACFPVTLMSNFCRNLSETVQVAVRDCLIFHFL